MYIKLIEMARMRHTSHRIGQTQQLDAFWKFKMIKLLEKIIQRL